MIEYRALGVRLVGRALGAQVSLIRQHVTALLRHDVDTGATGDVAEDAAGWVSALC